ncbi:MAG TPA: MFS transporter, partial [Sphingomicrobium sp.]|nr:MFS transporter [Sphingomicrobium sp.]
TCIGFFVIDRLAIPPAGSEQPIAIVMMAGAAAGLAAQWALIPKLALQPRALILWGSLIAGAGLVATMLATNLYGLVLGFAVSSLGFGFTRPGFTAGASLAVPLSEQGGVAGVVTAANGIAFVAAPAVGMALYHLDVRLPFAVSALLLAGLIAWGRARLD